MLVPLVLHDLQVMHGHLGTTVVFWLADPLRCCYYWCHSSTDTTVVTSLVGI